MNTYTTCIGESFTAEPYYSATATLGLTLVRTEDGRIYDVEGGEPYEIHDRNLPDVEQNIIDWMDDPAIQSADDFTGETKTDWDYIRSSV